MPEVLVIEAGQLFQHLYRAVFSTLGCRATCVRSSAEAFHAMEGAAPALMLLDVRSVEGDGLATARTVRRRTAFAGIPMLVVSAKLQEADRLELEQIGCVSFVAKPIQLETFSHTVRHCLALSSNSQRTVPHAAFSIPLDA